MQSAPGPLYCAVMYCAVMYCAMITGHEEPATLEAVLIDVAQGPCGGKPVRPPIAATAHLGCISSPAWKSCGDRDPSDLELHAPLLARTAGQARHRCARAQHPLPGQRCLAADRSGDRSQRPACGYDSVGRAANAEFCGQLDGAVYNAHGVSQPMGTMQPGRRAEMSVARTSVPVLLAEYTADASTFPSDHEEWARAAGTRLIRRFQLARKIQRGLADVA